MATTPSISPTPSERRVAQLQLALDAAHMGSWHFDPITKAITFDRRHAEIMGVPADATAQDVGKRIHPDDIQMLRQKTAEALNPANPTPYSVIFRVVHSDGSIRWIESNGMATFIGEGQDRHAVDFVGTSADITERRQSEDSAAVMTVKYDRQSRLFEQIASTTPDFIYVFDLNWKFLYANRRLLEVWGVTYDQAVGSGLADLGYPQWHIDMHHRELEQVVRTKQPIRGEVPFTGGSGIHGVYEYIFTPVLGPDGNVEVIAGTTRDVTERKQIDERRFRDAELLANVQDAVIVSDLNNIVTFWNDGAARLFGWPAEEIIGRPYVNRFPEHIRPEIATLAQKILTDNYQISGERLDYRKDGSRVWIEITTRQITDPNGKPLGIMGVARDITERKRAEAERDQLLASERAARAEAERASRMKDEFLATLSHELRTPLNAILGWSTILSTTRANEKDLRDGLETIQRNARAQTQIIEDLLDMSRIISGKVRLEVQRTDLAASVQAAVDTVRPAADARGVRLRVLLDSAASPVSGDPNRLQQIFWNLLTNAVKFTPRDGQVQVQLQRVGSQFQVTIADTGEGIKPEFLPHVFDRFRQADASTTRRHGGLGLGLAIVKQLVELHGGTIRAQSPGLGQGSTFTVLLPVTILHTDPTIEKSQRDSAPAYDPLAIELPSLVGLRILVVDDGPDASALVRRLLEERGAAVQTASSADEAFAIVTDRAPDVIISDIGMPGQDGYSLIRRIRTLPLDKGGAVPATALTAYARSEDRVRAIRAGFQTHIIKPADPAELITIVASLANRRR